LIFKSSPSGAPISFPEARGWSFTESSVPSEVSRKKVAGCKLRKGKIFPTG